MKQEAEESGRRRCCECRHWYVPDPRAKNSQKTCSKKCRRQRRASQEKTRRNADLLNARAADRERQRQWRARKRADGQKKGPVSQAGLSAELSGIIERIMQKLGQDHRLSQAGIRHLLRGILAKNGLGSANEVAKSGT